MSEILQSEQWHLRGQPTNTTQSLAIFYSRYPLTAPVNKKTLSITRPPQLKAAKTIQRFLRARLDRLKYTGYTLVPQGFLLSLPRSVICLNFVTSIPLPQYPWFATRPTRNASSLAKHLYDRLLRHAVDALPPDHMSRSKQLVLLDPPYIKTVSTTLIRLLHNDSLWKHLPRSDFMDLNLALNVDCVDGDGGTELIVRVPWSPPTI